MNAPTQMMTKMMAKMVSAPFLLFELKLNVLFSDRLSILDLQSQHQAKNQWSPKIPWNEVCFYVLQFLNSLPFSSLIFGSSTYFSLYPIIFKSRSFKQITLNELDLQSSHKLALPKCLPQNWVSARKQLPKPRIDLAKAWCPLAIPHYGPISQRFLLACYGFLFF
jgi:hypothetical protein